VRFPDRTAHNVKYYENYDDYDKYCFCGLQPSIFERYPEKFGTASSL